MAKNCDNCWYEKAGVIDEPCKSCAFTADNCGDYYSKWVSKSFLDNVEDSKVMTYTAEALTQAPKPSEGVKYDSDKPRWELVPFRAMAEVVEVLTYGSKKYSDNNWKIVPNARQRYISAAFRHLTAWADGEKKDKETGKSHLAHTMCCLLYLLWFEQEDECPPSKK